MRRFFLSKTEASGRKAVISGPDARHIRNVLRMKPGDYLTLFDGAGSDYRAQIVAVSSDKIEILIREPILSETESPVDIILAQALLKDRKLDEIIRQITELGVYSVIPFIAHRSVSRPDAGKRAGRRTRWEKIAKEAVKQCGRGRIPDIRPVASFRSMLDQTRAADAKILLWENESTPLSRTPRSFDVKSPRTIAVALGPEGGFTDEEVEAAKSRGYVTAGLGPRILKADTATVSACTLLQYLFGDMGQINS